MIPGSDHSTAVNDYQIRNAASVNRRQYAGIPQATVYPINAPNTIAPSNSMTPHNMNPPQMKYEPDRQIGVGAFGFVWAVTDPRTNQQIALKKMSNVFQNLTSCKRVFREIRMLDSFRNENVLGLMDILHPSDPDFFQEIYVLMELMQTDLHKIIASKQNLYDEHHKVFMYQILRGLKYIHSANIIHRDLKPANLLVNSNCVLKICDFGLARFWDPRDTDNMTHEVVTQYYRAPELLMGARRYTAAVDLWSVGCIFAELVSGRILFEAQGPIEQLNKILELLGTPPPQAFHEACDGAINHVKRLPYRMCQSDRLINLSPMLTPFSVDLLKSLLQFDSRDRITAKNALAHTYINDGRFRFHSRLCSCCMNGLQGERICCQNLEPTHINPINPLWEKELSRMTMFELRDNVHNFILGRPAINNKPLYIEGFKDSSVYTSFI